MVSSKSSRLGVWLRGGWSWLTQPIWEVFQREAIFGIKPDLLLPEKYNQIKNYYDGLCLDFGAGSGAFTQFLRKQGHSVIPIDIVTESRYPDIAPILYDGHTLPFAKDTFDTVICMFVLHHIQHQEDVLQELYRITKHRLIIGEDLVEGPADRFFTGTHNFLSGWGQAGHTYHPEAMWDDYFQTLSFQIAEKVAIPRYKIPAYPVHRMIYVLKK